MKKVLFALAPVLFLASVGILITYLAFSAQDSYLQNRKENLPKSLKATLDSAERSDKNVVLVFTASWCPPCQHMKKNVYYSNEVKPLRKDFIWRTIDLTDQKPNKTADLFGVRGIPHIEIIDSDARSLGKIVGGRSPKAFADFLRSTR